MTNYKHKVHYYETDKMGIVHHSNYIRWMEEARVDFLDEIGWSYAQLESVGLVSPVLSLDVEYKHSTYYVFSISIKSDNEEKNKKHNNFFKSILIIINIISILIALFLKLDVFYENGASYSFGP